MIRVDITDRWPELSSDPAAFQRAVLDVYGAERAEMAPFPLMALYAQSGQLLGFAKTYGYPRVTVEGERVLLELSDLVLDLSTARAEPREQLAALAHEQWSGWMRYMFGQGTQNADGTLTLPAWAVERWTRQMETPYSELPDAEQASDRTEADRVLALLWEGDS
jgi:hypothetical protein